MPQDTTAQQPPDLTFGFAYTALGSAMCTIPEEKLSPVTNFGSLNLARPSGLLRQFYVPMCI